MDISREYGKEVLFYYGLAVVFAPIFSHAVEWCFKSILEWFW
jgi:hypothetical protein